MKSFSAGGLCQLIFLANVVAVCCGGEAVAEDGDNTKTTDRVEKKPSDSDGASKHQSKAHRRHRRENDDGDGREAGGTSGGGGDGHHTPGDSSSSSSSAGGELENFIALAPDEADIYNFSNNLINAVDNVDQDEDDEGRGRSDDGDGDGGNANEVNPFNEFLNPRQQQQLEQREKQQLDQDGGGDPWGFGLDQPEQEQQLPPPSVSVYDQMQDQQQQEDENKNLKAVNRNRQQQQKHRQQKSSSPIVASSIDFLNSIDGGYLLSNGIINEKGQKMADDASPSTLKPVDNDGGDADNGGEQIDDDDIFEQMQKKAKSYRLKLYKKHKNFKHSHHHRGGYYHPLYQHHHHQYYQQKMLERERDRWKQLQQDQQLKSGYQGKIRYFDSSNKLETKEDIKAHLDGYSSREQWPNFDKVVTSLNKETQQDNVPPYIKKYNRRNKQLIDLLEGTIAPLSDYSQRHHERKYHRRKNPHWMEEDLFEEQRPNQNNLGLQRNYIQETIQSSTVHSNSLPGEGIHIIYDKKHNGDNDHEYGHPAGDPNHPYKLSSRAGQFVYHRVASPQPVGYGRLKRQRLPFVAITDRRLGTPPKRRPNSSSSSSASGSNDSGSSGSNLLNHQPMP